MIRSRIFRLRSFWLGLMGLFFLLWAWRDSMAYRSGIERYEVQWEDGNMSAAFAPFAGQERGGVRLQWFSYQVGGADSIKPKLLAWERKRLDSGIDLEPTDTNPFPRPSLKKSGRLINGDTIITRRILVLPHWLLILLYLAGWTGVVAWRWRAAGKREAGWNPQAKPEAP